MTDIALVWQDDGADIALDGSDLLADDGLETSIVISLGTDGLALPEDELPDGSDDRRGWWGDAYADVPGDRIGSRRWLLESAKAPEGLAQQVQAYDEECLAHLVEDGLAESVESVVEVIEGTTAGSYIVLSTIGIYRPLKPPFKYRFRRFWEPAA